jgi:hypothetical protein
MQLSEQKGGTGSKKLYTGVFSGEIRAVNPTSLELSELLGYELKSDAKEQSYESKDDKDNEVIVVSFWLQADTPEKPWFNARFRITDKVCTNKDGSKIQYVNQCGDSTYVDDKKNLADWFTSFSDKDKNKTGDKYVREALIGEANLYVFLKAWLSKVDWFSPDTNVLTDMKRMFRNVDKYVNDEYKALLPGTDGAKFVGNVVALAVVYTGEKDGKPVHYQNLYGEFLPPTIKEGSRYGVSTISVMNMSITSGNWSNPRLKKWHEQLSGEYGCKDSFQLVPLKEFVEGEHQQSTNETFREAPEDKSVITDTSY